MIGGAITQRKVEKGSSRHRKARIDHAASRIRVLVRFTILLQPCAVCGGIRGCVFAEQFVADLVPTI